ncbi:GDSL-type esterase/lipase family protein [Lewinella sp. W8]|uniref:SGNH/GDSL hydrolase family protein n=1 Tax=Lewinella sp. W8 TaxID=2528208 RepID=UPI001564420B|nr:GDSL-type esterase/lipase family protein [Lewinella sp. W8]
MSRLLLPLIFLVFTACSARFSKQHLLVIGDSNAVGKGWVDQLQQLRGGGPLVNTALSGNTIGFNYGSEMSMNTLENLTSYLRQGYAEMGQIDEVIIALGTNDCKARFGGQHGNIITNLTTLTKRTRDFFTSRGQEVPRIVLVSPPPMASDEVVIDEFTGGAACVAELTEAVKALATREGYCFVNLLEQPGSTLLSNSEDGIHFSLEGDRLIAQSVIKTCY